MKAAYIFLFVLGLAMLIVALSLAGRSAAILWRGQRAVGEVVRMQKDAGSASSSTTYAPILRYRTKDGRTLEAAGPPESFPQYGLGDRVPLHFSRSKPSQIRLDTFDGLWTPAVASGIIALLFAGVGGVIWWSERGAQAPTLVGAVFLLIGLPLLIGGVASAAGQGLLFGQGKRATGRVMNAEGLAWKLFKTSGESRELPAVIRYRTEDEREIEFTTPTINAAYLPKEAQVELVYRRDRPFAAAVLGFQAFWLTSLILSGAGLLMALIGWGSLRYGGKKRKIWRQ